MRIARYAHPTPLPGRSYWALWEGEVPVVVFSVGPENVLVEHPLTVEHLGHLIRWLAEMMTAVEWPQLTLVCTLSADTLQRLASPQPAPKRKKPARRRSSPVAFLQR